MAKPVKLPQWNTDLSNQTEPSAGQKTTGWTFKQKAISAYFNWLFYWIYQWIVWLDAGVWTAVSLVLSGDLTAVNLVATTNVTGVALKYTGELARTMHFQDAFDNLTTFAISTHAVTLDVITLAASATPVYFPVRGVTAGDIIRSFAFDLVKNTNGSCTDTAALVYRDGSGETVVGGTTITDNSNAPGLILFAATGLAITLTAGRRYYIKFTPGNSVTPAADLLKNLNVSWDNA